MKLYLVRHAKSRAMENNERQSSKSPLSEAGKNQASALAKRMAAVKIDAIISSNNFDDLILTATTFLFSILNPM